MIKVSNLRIMIIVFKLKYILYKILSLNNKKQPFHIKNILKELII